ncbi:MAG: IS66-like element accessory protein TnpA [Janthinobacterium lividum]
MDGVVEIITGRERRRRWSTQEKLRIVGETHEPGACVGDVAARHGVCASLVFTWRRQVRQGVLTAAEVPTFVPVRMLEPATTAVAAPSAVAPSLVASPAGLIEIELGDGRRVRVGSDVNLPALRRVLAALGR